MKRIGKWLLIGFGALIVLAVIGSMMDPAEETAGASPTATPAATEDAPDEPEATAEVTAEPQTTPEPTAEPTATPVESIDPEAAFGLFTILFADAWDSDFRNEMADAIEADFYWVDSVDRLTYDADAHRMVVEATVDYELVYRNDPDEWHDDTWALYRSWSTHVWGSFVEGFGETAGMTPDWSRWTPGLAFIANTGRLAADCSGDLIYRVSEREATQREFISECSFTK